MTEQDYLDEIERKSKEIQEAKKAIEDLKKPKLQLEHNAVYRMSDGSVKMAYILGHGCGHYSFILKGLKENDNSYTTNSDGTLRCNLGHAVEKIGKLAVVAANTNFCWEGTGLGAYANTRAGCPESLTGEKL